MLIKNIITIMGITSAVLFSAEYDVGDIVDEDDQDIRFTICNGDFFNNDLKLSHLNGDLNGGHYFVSWFDISATW
ncbi:uncharacterized protein METZ01_LOCUS402529 [marine metagenome]|uniref:Uncharacterized protein n=1 Tax=marine metagenome TaxID=408172 RepID=A0A382VUF7_9ZZZZ